RQRSPASRAFRPVPFLHPSDHSTRERSPRPGALRAEHRYRRASLRASCRLAGSRQSEPSRRRRHGLPMRRTTERWRRQTPRQAAFSRTTSPKLRLLLFRVAQEPGVPKPNFAHECASAPRPMGSGSQPEQAELQVEHEIVANRVMGEKLAAMEGEEMDLLGGKASSGRRMAEEQADMAPAHDAAHG